jgi:hypothetical protein
MELRHIHQKYSLIFWIIIFITEFSYIIFLHILDILAS